VPALPSGANPPPPGSSPTGRSIRASAVPSKLRSQTAADGSLTAKYASLARRRTPRGSLISGGRKVAQPTGSSKQRRVP
jgi:hypothetical protein